VWLRAPLHVSDDDDPLMHAAMDYWETLTECMAKDWIVTVGYNPEHPEEHCAVTLRNWRTGAFWDRCTR
jgi:hypothetical protein